MRPKKSLCLLCTYIPLRIRIILISLFRRHNIVFLGCAADRWSGTSKAYAVSVIEALGFPISRRSMVFCAKMSLYS